LEIVHQGELTRGCSDLKMTWLLWLSTLMESSQMMAGSNQWVRFVTLGWLILTKMWALCHQCKGHKRLPGLRSDATVLRDYGMMMMMMFTWSLSLN